MNGDMYLDINDQIVPELKTIFQREREGEKGGGGVGRVVEWLCETDSERSFCNVYINVQC